jgi:hypothetical protein
MTPLDCALPPEFKAVPFPETQVGPGLKLCLVVRTAAHPKTKGYFELLRDFPGVIVFLGCLTDQEDRPHQWVEIWVQNRRTLCLADALEEEAKAEMTSVSVDGHWANQCDVFDNAGPGMLLKTGWESSHPKPLFYDPAAGCLVYPELPLPQLPASASEAAEPKGSFLVPVNPDGGLLMTVPHFPLSYDDGVDLIGGRPWKQIESASSFTLDGAYRRLEKVGGDGRGYGCLYWGQHEMTGRLIEVLHLKLQLLAAAFRAVRRSVQVQDLPLLNITDESFRMRLHPISSDLPLLWTLELVLTKTSRARGVNLPEKDCKRFELFGEADNSVYSQAGIAETFAGKGNLIVTKVSPLSSGEMTFEGTLTTRTALDDFSPQDLLEFTLPLADRPEVFHGHLLREAAAKKGVYGFQTVARQVTPAILEALQNSGEFVKRDFKIIPIIGTPIDLFALSVLAVRTLLVCSQSTINATRAELNRLGLLAAERNEPAAELEERIRALLEEDAKAENPRWLPELGPQRLLQGESDARETLRRVPLEIWADVLAFMLQLQPGVLPESFCRDNADFPPGNLAAVFDRPIERLESLLVRTRSLLLVDWNFNREINQIVQNMLG